MGFQAADHNLLAHGSFFRFLVQVKAKYPDQIKVFYSATCDSIEQLPGGVGIEVRASLRASGGGSGGGDDKGEGEKKVFRPQLLVGADGLSSMVSGFFAAGVYGQRGNRGALWLVGWGRDGGDILPRFFLFRLSFYLSYVFWIRTTAVPVSTWYMAGTSNDMTFRMYLRIRRKCMGSRSCFFILSFLPGLLRPPYLCGHRPSSTAVVAQSVVVGEGGRNSAQGGDLFFSGT